MCPTDIHTYVHLVTVLQPGFYHGKLSSAAIVHREREERECKRERERDREERERERERGHTTLFTSVSLPT